MTGPFHWRNRRLSTRELCRIQTFPDDYAIRGGRTEAQRQLGNAVPALLAEVLAMEIRRQILACPLDRTQPTLTIHRTSSTPSPEPVAEVPEKYLHLLGEHAAHPGTGKGYQVAGSWG